MAESHHRYRRIGVKSLNTSEETEAVNFLAYLRKIQTSSTPFSTTKLFPLITTISHHIFDDNTSKKTLQSNNNNIRSSIFRLTYSLRKTTFESWPIWEDLIINGQFIFILKVLIKECHNNTFTSLLYDPLVKLIGISWLGEIVSIHSNVNSNMKEIEKVIRKNILQIIDIYNVTTNDNIPSVRSSAFLTFYNLTFSIITNGFHLYNHKYEYNHLFVIFSYFALEKVNDIDIATRKGAISLLSLVGLYIRFSPCMYYSSMLNRLLCGSLTSCFNNSQYKAVISWIQSILLPFNFNSNDRINEIDWRKNIIITSRLQFGSPLWQSKSKTKHGIYSTNDKLSSINDSTLINIGCLMTAAQFLIKSKLRSPPRRNPLETLEFIESLLLPSLKSSSKKPIKLNLNKSIKDESKSNINNNGIQQSSNSNININIDSVSISNTSKIEEDLITSFINIMDLDEENSNDSDEDEKRRLNLNSTINPINNGDIQESILIPINNINNSSSKNENELELEITQNEKEKEIKINKSTQEQNYSFISSPYSYYIILSFVNLLEKYIVNAYHGSYSLSLPDKNIRVFYQGNREVAEKFFFRMRLRILATARATGSPSLVLYYSEHSLMNFLVQIYNEKYHNNKSKSIQNDKALALHRSINRYILLSAEQNLIRNNNNILGWKSIVYFVNDHYNGNINNNDNLKFSLKLIECMNLQANDCLEKAIFDYRNLLQSIITSFINLKFNINLNDMMNNDLLDILEYVVNKNKNKMIDTERTIKIPPYNTCILSLVLTHLTRCYIELSDWEGLNLWIKEWTLIKPILSSSYDSTIVYTDRELIYAKALTQFDLCKYEDTLFMIDPLIDTTNYNNSKHIHHWSFLSTPIHPKNILILSTIAMLLSDINKDTKKEKTIFVDLISKRLDQIKNICEEMIQTCFPFRPVFLSNYFTTLNLVNAIEKGQSSLINTCNLPLLSNKYLYSHSTPLFHLIGHSGLSRDHLSAVSHDQKFLLFANENEYEDNISSSEYHDMLRMKKSLRYLNRSNDDYLDCDLLLNFCNSTIRKGNYKLTKKLLEQDLFINSKSKLTLKQSSLYGILKIKANRIIDNNTKYNCLQDLVGLYSTIKASIKEKETQNIDNDDSGIFSTVNMILDVYSNILLSDTSSEINRAMTLFPPITNSNPNPISSPIVCLENLLLQSVDDFKYENNENIAYANKRFADWCYQAGSHVICPVITFHKNKSCCVPAYHELDEHFSYLSKQTLYRDQRDYDRILENLKSCKRAINNDIDFDFSALDCDNVNVTNENDIKCYCELACKCIGLISEILSMRFHSLNEDAQDNNDEYFTKEISTLFPSRLPMVSRDMYPLFIEITISRWELSSSYFNLSINAYFKVLKLVSNSNTNRNKNDRIVSKQLSSPHSTILFHMINLLLNYSYPFNRLNSDDNNNITDSLYKNFTDIITGYSYLLESAIPQLIDYLSRKSNSNTVNIKLFSFLKQLITSVTPLFPSNVIFPLLTINQENLEEKNQVIQDILNSIKTDSMFDKKIDSTNKLISKIDSTKKIISEFIRISVSHEDIWYPKIQKLHAGLPSRINLLQNEYEFLQSSIPRGEQLRKMLSSHYSLVMNPFLNDLKQLLSETIIDDDDSDKITSHEKKFNREYNRILTSVIDLLKKTPDSVDILNNVWNKTKKILSEFYVLLRQNTLSLCDVSPYLSKYGDGIHLPGMPTDVCSTSFSSTIRLFTTKTRPKRFTIYGSDGNAYRYLLKAHENPYRDHSVMKLLDNITNIFTDYGLQESPIKTFAIIPLSSNCGLIQWIDNSCTLFDLIQNYTARSKNTNCPPTTVVAYYKKIASCLKKNGLSNAFKQSSDCPPHILLNVYNELRHLTPFNLINNELWMSSSIIEEYLFKQRNYIISSAIWSILGFVLGLGDRHLGNILLNTQSGILSHIDYSVLFDKGLLLNIPEIVPFRMTKIMIGALGPCGYKTNSVFQINCCKTLSSLQSYGSSLLLFLCSWDKIQNQNENMKDYTENKNTESEFENLVELLSFRLENRIPKIRDFYTDVISVTAEKIDKSCKTIENAIEEFETKNDYLNTIIKQETESTRKLKQSQMEIDRAKHVTESLRSSSNSIYLSRAKEVSNVLQFLITECSDKCNDFKKNLSELRGNFIPSLLQRLAGLASSAISYGGPAQALKIKKNTSEEITRPLRLMNSLPEEFIANLNGENEKIKAKNFNITIPNYDFNTRECIDKEDYFISLTVDLSSSLLGVIQILNQYRTIMFDDTNNIDSFEILNDNTMNRCFEFLSQAQNNPTCDINEIIHVLKPHKKEIDMRLINTLSTEIKESKKTLSSSSQNKAQQEHNLAMLKLTHRQLQQYIWLYCPLSLLPNFIDSQSNDLLSLDAWVKKLKSSLSLLDKSYKKLINNEEKGDLIKTEDILLSLVTDWSNSIARSTNLKTKIKSFYSQDFYIRVCSRRAGTKALLSECEAVICLANSIVDLEEYRNINSNVSVSIMERSKAMHAEYSKASVAVSSFLEKISQADNTLSSYFTTHEILQLKHTKLTSQINMEQDNLSEIQNAINKHYKTLKVYCEELRENLNQDLFFINDTKHLLQLVSKNDENSIISSECINLIKYIECLHDNFTISSDLRDNPLYIALKKSINKIENGSLTSLINSILLSWTNLSMKTLKLDQSRPRNKIENPFEKKPKSEFGLKNSSIDNDNFNVWHIIRQVRNKLLGEIELTSLTERKNIAKMCSKSNTPPKCVLEFNDIDKEEFNYKRTLSNRVDLLIERSTSSKQLSEMYPGWNSWI